MAHSFDTSLYGTNNTDPTTISYTCGTGVTLLVLNVGVVTTTRTVSPPTFGGKLMTNINRQGYDPGACLGELWYLLNPSTNAAYTISVSNPATSRVLHLVGSSYKAQAGYTSIYDSSSFIGSTSLANPTTQVIITTAGSVAVQMMALGENSEPTGYTHTRLFSVDPGAYTFEGQYTFLNTNASMGCTVAADQVTLITGVWKESAAAPFTPTLSTPTDNTTNASINATFTWVAAKAGPTASSYGIQICSSSSFITNDISVSGVTNLYYFANNPSLAYTTDYWWRVNATNATGNSDFTSAWKLTTAGSTSIKAVSGVTYATISKISTVAIASISKVGGLA